MSKKNKKSKISVYEIITNRFIEMLERGVVPWRKPWNNFQAIRWSVQKPYRGINTLLLEPGEYATRKQIEDAGGRIKESELKKSHIAVFWRPSWESGILHEIRYRLLTKLIKFLLPTHNRKGSGGEKNAKKI